MEKTKAHFVAVYDAAGNLPSLSAGNLVVPGDDGSGGENGRFEIPFSSIIKSSFAGGATGTLETF
jgi:hypothetical protein